MPKTNGQDPPEQQRERTIAARTAGKLRTLEGVRITDACFGAAVDVIADEIRDLTKEIDQRDAEVVRAALQPAMTLPLGPDDVASIAASVHARYESILKTEGSATGPIKLHLTELAAGKRRAEIAAESANAKLWRLERQRRDDAAAMERLHNRNAELQAELDELRAGLDDTDVITDAAACGTCADTHEAMVDGKYVDCPKCGPAPTECGRCLGDGKQHEHHMRGHYPETLVSTCDQCGGTGTEPVDPLIIDDSGPSYVELIIIAYRTGGPG